LSAASAIGATLAVLIIAGLPGTIRREPLLAVVCFGYGLALLALARAPGLTVALLAMLAIGACASAFDTLQQTLIQFAVPDDQRGRAVGIWVFSIGTAPVGHLEVGVLAATLGAPAALLVNGAFVVLGALALAVQAPAYRWQRLLRFHERLSAFAEPHPAPDKGNSEVTPEPPP
jgi:MFS family permease